jgi:hypothetical protein
MRHKIFPYFQSIFPILFISYKGIAIQLRLETCGHFLSYVTKYNVDPLCDEVRTKHHFHGIWDKNAKLQPNKEKVLDKPQFSIHSTN